MICAATGYIYIGNTSQIAARLNNRSDLTTPVTDATVKWEVVDDDGPQTGDMTWDPTYDIDGVVGWYVGTIPETLAWTEYKQYEFFVSGLGGSLDGAYYDRDIRQAVYR